MRPFNRKIHPGGWRGFLDYANGTLGDWGVHWLDQVLWWTEEKHPKRIFCSGGRQISGPAILNEKEQTSDAPDHMAAIYEFENFTCTWEHRHFAENNTEKHRIGAYFYGTKGILHIGWRDGWTFYPTRERDKPIHEDAQLQEPDGHNLRLLWADFLEAIEKKHLAVARIDLAHRASILPLLGMVSWRLGRSIQWDGEKETVLGDEKAIALLSREYRSPWKYPAI
jgi:predicted dehydrogenase